MKMPAKAPRQPQTARAPGPRVAAPPTQKKTKRLPPAFALAWLHLLPDQAFPIRSRDDLAVKISALLLRGALPGAAAQPVGHALPAGAQSQSRKKRGAR
jgi:hypothetical protein